MRILVLGKTGQVGWELQRALSTLGEVIALGREEANFEDVAQLKAAVSKASPDVIVNATAYTAVDKAESEPDRADRINHRAAADLAELAARRGAWLVHYSTDYVFDGRKSTAYVETDETAPQSIYGRTKRDGETAVLDSGANALILRTSWVHAGRGKNFVRTILRLASEREELRVVADQVGAPTGGELIADVTAHAVAAITRGTPIAAGIYHLTAAGETTWYGLAQFAVAEALQLGGRLKMTPDGILPIKTTDYPTAAVRPANSRLDTRKLRKALGTTLPDWRVHASRSVAQLLKERP